MNRITGIRPQVSAFQRLRFKNIKPNIKSLCDKAIIGKIEQGDLNHLVVHLENDPKALRYESGDIAEFIFLPVMEDAYPEAMKKTARFGLELLAVEGRRGNWTAKEIIEKLDKAEPTKPAPGPIAPPPIVTPRPLVAKPAPVLPPLPVQPVTPPPLPKPVQVAPAREVPPPTRLATSIKIGDETFLFSEITFPPTFEATKRTKTGILSKACVLWKVSWEKGTQLEFDQTGKPLKAVLSQPKSFGNIEFPKGTELDIENLEHLQMIGTLLHRTARFGTTDFPAGTRVGIWTDGKLYQATLKSPQSFYGVEYPAKTPIWFSHNQQYARTIQIVEKKGKTIGGEHFSESMTIDFLASGKIRTAHYHCSHHEREPLPVAVNIWGRTFELINAYVHFNNAGEKETIELIEGQELFGCFLPAKTLISKEKTGKIVAQTPDGKSIILK